MGQGFSNIPSLDPLRASTEAAMSVTKNWVEEQTAVPYAIVNGITYVATPHSQEKHTEIQQALELVRFGDKGEKQIGQTEIVQVPFPKYQALLDALTPHFRSDTTTSDSLDNLKPVSRESIRGLIAEAGVRHDSDSAGSTGRGRTPQTIGASGERP